MGKRRILRQLEDEVRREEEQEAAYQRQLKQQEEEELEARRYREDPLGHDRWLYAHEHTMDVIDEEQARGGWSFFDSYHRGAPLPERVEAAMLEQQKLREEWLYGIATSVRTGGQLWTDDARGERGRLGGG